MPLKPFLAFALAASFVAPVALEARPHGHVSPRHGHGPVAWHRSHSPYLHRHGPHWRTRTSFYFGFPFYHGFGYRGYAPVYANYGYYETPVYSVARPNYAANGLLLGALAGAVIGNNSGDLRHNAWTGAALGATAGYVLGSLAENRAEQPAAAPVVSTPATPSAVAPAAALAPSAPPSTAASPPAATSPMAAANTLFGR
jgi:hypothetical protein